MINNSDLDVKQELALLVGLDFGDDSSLVSVLELAELAKTAGCEVFDTIVQKRRKESLDPKICIGKGKLTDIKNIVDENDIDVVIFDIELSPSQITNIASIVGVKIIDRTILILDIFASRAKTKEGKLQVELAQLKHSYSSLAGQGITLSRQGGGIGTRGPGETQLETDRRHIRRRVDKISAELEIVKKQRSQIRKNRQRKEFKTVALVGYTNAGKSTLFNNLTKSDVYVANQLFATLDSTTRLLPLDDMHQNVTLVDTVGFIRNLPHHLIDAFKATLEEVLLSDIVLLVIDSSDEQYLKHVEITLKILEELGFENEIIKVYNKSDIINENINTSDGICVSARTSLGLDTLKKELVTKLFGELVEVELHVPYDRGDVVAELNAKKCVLSIEFNEFYQNIKICIDKRDIYRYNIFVCNVNI